MDFIPELVATGFLGFAVAIMYLAYRLLTELVTAENPGTPAILKQRTRAIMMFLVLSASVLLMGIFFSFFEPTDEMNISLSILSQSEDIPNGVEIVRTDGRVEIYDPKRNKIKILKGNPLVINLARIEQRIELLERDIELLSKANIGLGKTASTLKDIAVDSPIDNPEESF
ncbi:hypothetical protein SAMN05444273_107115 [Litoreibacter ascidiaceicola]|uniref:Uncharacterized protein n=1 Tax=Litoreibacter ascidiaceicola TaxID=1486859 RepID=A0A1M5CG33_9RHOB|nr:hypothetical protein [Litoreibacter ascidiaceicola]SHF53724.1 hypothetical protein SAMN05444273_107115 [Litoreibacter ascidiaceicola]